jgi:hypothetical protein
MPTKPRWHPKLARIRRELIALVDQPDVDRATIERMFGIRARQANNIMRSFDGRKTGHRDHIDRLQLIERLDELAAPKGVASAATKQKRTVIASYNALLRRERPRRIAPPPPPPEPTLLPSGVAITAPGEMAIKFSTPEELLSAIMAMAESANKDFAGFEMSLEYRTSRSLVCTYQNDNSVPAPVPEAAAAPIEEA